MAEMICPYCKIEYPTDYKWCMDDGSELEQNMGQYDENSDGGTKVPCPDCGEPVDTRDIYCGNCASKIEGRLPVVETDDDYYDDEPADDYVEPAAQEEYYEEPKGPTRPCPKCGVDVGLADTFCGECGAQLESAIPASSFDGTIQGRCCPHCAAGIEPEDTFCGACGHAVEAEVASAATMTCESCGMEVTSEDTFCGTCGAPVQKAGAAAPAEDAGYDEAVAGEAPEASYDAVAAGSCPNCGMDITPEDTFCGTCGAALQAGGGAAAAPEASYDEAPAPAPVSDDGGFDDYQPAAGGGSCPNCGMDITPEDTFCGTCGAALQAGGEAAAAPEASYDAAPGEAESYDDYSEPEQSSAPSISDFTKDIPVCPSCGIQGEPGQTSCYTCGVEMTTDGTLAPGAPSSYNEAEGSDDAFAAPEMGDGGGSDGEKICSCCGVSSPPEAEFCGNCGIDF